MVGWFHGTMPMVVLGHGVGGGSTVRWWYDMMMRRCWVVQQFGGATVGCYVGWQLGGVMVRWHEGGSMVRWWCDSTE
ncbi:hypothetical protein Hanom_Chr01g00015101 [Helianthus anomalus]